MNEMVESYIICQKCGKGRKTLESPEWHMKATMDDETFFDFCEGCGLPATNHIAIPDNGVMVPWKERTWESP